MSQADRVITEELPGAQRNAARLLEISLVEHSAELESLARTLQQTLQGIEDYPASDLTSEDL